MNIQVVHLNSHCFRPMSWFFKSRYFRGADPGNELIPPHLRFCCLCSCAFFFLCSSSIFPDDPGSQENVHLYFFSFHHLVRVDELLQQNLPKCSVITQSCILSHAAFSIDVPSWSGNCPLSTDSGILALSVLWCGHLQQVTPGLLLRERVLWRKHTQLGGDTHHFHSRSTGWN